MEICVEVEGGSYETELDLARTAEAAGFHGYFRADHLMRSGNPDTTPAATDAWISLAGLARETTQLRLGTLMCSSTFRHPGQLAVMVSQVNAMSGGRVELGIGAGSSPAEHLSLGIPLYPIAERFDRLEDQLELILSLWNAPFGRPFSYKGSYYEVKDYPALFRPSQTPRPPIIIGGHGAKRTPSVAARFADEFNIDWTTPSESKSAYERVKRACESIGRDPADLSLSASIVLCCGPNQTEITRRREAIVAQFAGGEDPAIVDRGLIGTPDQVIDRLGEYAAAGADRVYVEVYDMHDLDHLYLVGEEVLPALA